MAWFLVGGAALIIGMGMREENRIEDRRRFDAEMADRRDARKADCQRMTRQLAECETAYRAACQDILAMHDKYKC